MVEKATQATQAGATAGEDSQGPKAKYVDLVFQGGGVKGIALVGAYSVLEERGFKPQNLAGASIGSLIATLIAAGWTAGELREIIADLDFRRFRDKGWEDYLPLVGRSVSILRNQGMYEGKVLHRWIRDMLEAKGIRTFRDLVHPAYADQPYYRHKVQVIVSDVTNRELLVLPREAHRLGIHPDQLSVALAVRMSTSLPIFFEPVRFRNPRTGRRHLLVAGGVLSNFPVWLFDAEGVPEWPTFGLVLLEQDPIAAEVGMRRERRGMRWPRFKKQQPGGQRTNIIRFSRSLFDTMIQAHDRQSMDQATAARTISIPIPRMKATDFNLSRTEALKLYDAGRAAAERFLETWDFQDYIRKYRSDRQ